MTDYTWPDDLVPFAQGFMSRSHTGGSQSPFDLSTKTYGLSPPRWQCSMSFRGGYDGATGLEAYGPRLDAMLARLKGRENRVWIYDFRRMTWRGGSLPTGNLAAAQGATVMTVNGLPPGQDVYEGDYLGGDGRPHIITTSTAADGSGRAVVSFQPPLDIAIAANAATYGKPPGRFMLVDDMQGDNLVAVGDPASISLSFIEDPVPVTYAPAPGSLIAPGVFFDTTLGDTFTGAKIAVPTNASLIVSSSNIVFTHTGSDLSLDAQIKDANGNVRKIAFTDLTFEATYTVRPFDIAGSLGVRLGLAPNDAINDYGGMVGSHGAYATRPMCWVVTTGAGHDNDDGSGPDLTGGVTVLSKVEILGDLIKHTVTYPAGTQVLTQTMDYTADSYEMPVLFSALGLRFVRADMTVTKLKVSANYPGAKFAFLGDSLTQGRLASNFANGFAAKVRADYSGQVLIAGAPSAQTSDWKTAQHMQSFTDMAPQYAFVMLGTNDFSNGRSLSAIEADYTLIVNSLIDASIVPIVCAVPPKGDSNVPTFNTWLAAQGWLFVDTYTPLLGTGTSLNATYDHGDGIHPNDAGHAVIHSTIAAFIAANGL